MNRVVKREDLEELKHYGVKGMKWAEKNQKALPSSDFQAKARELLDVNFVNPKKKKWDEPNPNIKLMPDEFNPTLDELSPEEIKVYKALTPAEQKLYDRVEKKRKETRDKTLAGRTKKKVDDFIKSIFTETTSYHVVGDAKKKQGPPKPKK